MTFNKDADERLFHAPDDTQAALDYGVDLDSPEAGPKPVISLRRRGSSLASAAEQLRTLGTLDLVDAQGRPANFEQHIADIGMARGLRPAPLEIFQINVGKLCNMTCKHCHVDAGPDRVEAMMTRATAEACLAALDQTDCRTVDITGGAPELNPNFRFLVEESIKRGKHVIDRCNLTILLVPKFADLPEWLAERGVEVVCSLPHYRQRNTDAQRGDGAYEKSIQALRRLNEAGYGQGDPNKILTLMTNPAGAFLAGSQASMEREWKAALERDHGARFDRLIALNNMPISRFLEWLQNSGNLVSYMNRLLDGFNPATVPGVMCRNTVSVGWDGRVYDCDFNQMLDMEIAVEGSSSEGAMTVFEFSPEKFAARRIRTARHCYGCTAGAGSSCGGATA
ncbi:MAG: arsenosugar biosynthesis radical SAM protein ArsS [Deltaproteobacteria bacterium]|nr:arsenosugar biosynthesis radical SAM protein ArsS [Deltaproteobacteria bacterium]MCB9490205.1 arsenosugar biosynthesis radical SAM protein ArsS [Deltaproteobacteria bacterium]